MDQRDRVERAKRGDHDAFADLVDLRLARLDAAARLILRDPELARDAVQEALIRAWRDLPGLRDPDRFDGWLHKLTVNACLDLLRRRRRRAIEVELTPIDMPAGIDIAGALADRDLVDRALARLDPGHRAVVALHYLLGMPLPEVASSLGIPLGTAKSRLHYSLAAMRVTTAAEIRADPGRSDRRAGRMTTDRLERALPDILLDLYLQPDVPYRDDLVGRTERMRQRPAWTFPGRWLPMADITRERVAAPGLPWRTIGIALVIIALLVGAHRRRRLAACRAPATVRRREDRPGRVSQDGDIFVADQSSGKTTAIVTGDSLDQDPRWSLDGTRIAFARKAADGGGWQAYAVRPDGQDLVLLTPEPLLRIDGFSFSPDGGSVLIEGSAPVTMDGVNTTEQSIFIAASDGSGIHRIDVGMQALDAAFLPPNGEEIVFVGAPYMNARTGIYAVRVDGTGLRTIRRADRATTRAGSTRRPTARGSRTTSGMTTWI